jgi:hypothetical protein
LAGALSVGMGMDDGDQETRDDKNLISHTSFRANYFYFRFQ